MVVGAMFVLAACGGRGAEAGPAAAERWAGTWSASQQLTEERNLPPPPGLGGNTLRQVVQVPIGGEWLRVRFSNRFGTAPVEIAATRIAGSVGGSAIAPGTERALTFGGRIRAVTVSPSTGAISFMRPVVSVHRDAPLSARRERHGFSPRIK